MNTFLSKLMFKFQNQVKIIWQLTSVAEVTIFWQFLQTSKKNQAPPL